ncbi:hypothetical protein C9F11_42985 (plasmid) [Streptomyces sp. YIM 121038]|uniref:hypothetical protein n=1 Tax=Streptomyces sp. YIM 121038 TaxID=2136401 RepID=UPI00110FFE40|nr:hypothetical protein [Streptomyces sp. YIM 121038]QCX82177.1 hypothetical protein C9F11_42985 [Streptomyces sp. YIM 121038]
MKSAPRAAPRRALRIWLIAIPVALLLSLAAAVAFADTVPNPHPNPAPVAPDAKPTTKPKPDNKDKPGSGAGKDKGKGKPDPCDMLPDGSPQQKYCKEGSGSGDGAGGGDKPAAKPKPKPEPEDSYNPMEPRPGVTPPAPLPGDEDRPIKDLTKSPADGSDGLLQPFNVKDKDGVPISAYSVDADTGDWNDIDLKIWNLLAQFFFGVAKWFVGFSGWLIDWALNFGLAKILVEPADDIATSLRDQVINRLGLPGLFLLFSFLYAAWQILFKNRSRGFAEAGVSLVVAAIATTVLLSPAQVLLGTHDQPSPGGSTMLLSDDGMIGKAKDLSLEVSAVILSQDPKNEAKPENVSRPITDALVDAFIVKPTQLMLYGHTFTDPKCSKAFAEASLVKYNFEQMGIDFFEANRINPTGEATYAAQLKNAGEHFTKVCKVKKGDAKKASADMTFSAAFVALAAIIVSVLMVLVTSTFLVSQGWLAVEAIKGHWALAAGILPGGGRGVLWRWCSAIAKAILGVILAIIFLGVFIVVMIALVDADTGDVLAVKFICLDLAAVAGLVGQKKIKETARQVSVNLNRRLANARIGGSRQSVFNQFGRYAETAPGVKQLFGEARGEARKVTKPLGQAGRTAKQMWMGKPQGGKGGGRLRSAARLATNAAAAVGTGGAATAARAAAQGAAKQALRRRLATATANKLSQSRGGRGVLMAGKGAAATARLGWKTTKVATLATVGAPVGIPRGIAAAKRGGAAATARANAVKGQLTAAKARAGAQVTAKVDGARAFGEEYRRNLQTAGRFVGRHAANAQLGMAQPMAAPTRPSSPPGTRAAAVAPLVPGPTPASATPPSGTPSGPTTTAPAPSNPGGGTPPPSSSGPRPIRRATRPAGPPRRRP